MFNSLLFSNGFLITNKKIEHYSDSSTYDLLSKWRHFVAGSYNIYLHTNTPAFSAKKNNLEMHLFGLVVDPLGLEIDENIIVDKLTEKYSTSTSEFYAYLNTLTGRFALIVCSENRTFILQDATGDKMVVYYYDKSDNVFISSHSYLIAQLHNLNNCDEAATIINAAHYPVWLPGIATLYTDVFSLLPNTYLDIKEKRVKRFFPKSALEDSKSDSFLIDEVASFLVAQINLLHKKCKLSISLTAGVDSRLTLATTKDLINDIYYFSYFNGRPNFDNDMIFASSLASKLSIKHNTHYFNSVPLTPDDVNFLDVFWKNTSYIRPIEAGLRAKALYENHPKNMLHIKSNCSEIARCYYQKNNPFLPDKIQPETLARVYNKDNKPTAFMVDAFKLYCKKMNFNNKSIYNYNPYDLFYWEHKMGAWQSTQMLEYDMSINTINIFNNRYLLKKLLSVSLSKRINDDLYRELMRRLWPETLEMDFNPWRKAGLIRKIARKCYHTYRTYNAYRKVSRP